MSQADLLDLLDQFKQAIDGLTVMSESDYPIDVLRWQITPPLTISELLRLADKPADSFIEVVDVEAFFTPMTRAGEAQAIVDRFRALVKLIQDTLSGVQVYRVGKIAIDVYIVGKPAAHDPDQDTDWIVLATKVIET